MLIYGAGTMLFFAFALNLYVGLVDRNMIAPPNIVITPHYYVNWIITVINVVCSGILFLSATNKKWLFAASGIVWPLFYIGLIVADIESKLCFGAAASTCFPSVASAEEYLLFGKSTVVTVYFWPYTFMVILILLVLSVALCSLGLYLLIKPSDSTSVGIGQKKNNDLKRRREQQEDKPPDDKVQAFFEFSDNLVF
jgi:hypothetical protein